MEFEAADPSSWGKRRSRKASMKKNYSEDEDALIVEEIQSFLQEKRTALKAIRMGIAVILAQLSAVGFLVTAFRRHAIIQAMHWVDILVVLGVILLGTAIYLFVYPLMRIRRLNRKILEFEQRHDKVVNLTD
jgi:membrane protein YdbS with pleckstrin-like domain